MIIDFHARLVREHEGFTYEIDKQMADMVKNHISLRLLSCAEGDRNNLEVYNVSKQYPDFFVPVALINPKEDKSIEETKVLLNDYSFNIIEFDPLEHGYQPELLDYRINPILDIADKYHALVKINTGSTYRGAPDSWIKYFKRYPDLKFVVLHMGAGDFQYGTINLAKEYSNLYLETSIACEYPALKKCLAEISDSRLLFGSNYPDYFTELEVMKFDYYNLSDQQKERILYKNALSVLNREGGDLVER